MRWLAVAAVLAVIAAILGIATLSPVLSPAVKTTQSGHGDNFEMESGKLPIDSDFLPTYEDDIAEAIAANEGSNPHFGTAGADLSPHPEDWPKPCYRYGVRGPCVDKKAMLDELDQARYGIRTSSDMLVGRRYPVSLTINPDGKIDLQEGSETNVVAEGTTKVALRMEAELFGAQFNIEPKGRTERELLELNPTKWTWVVTPLEAGKLPLEFSLYVILTDDKGKKISEDKPLVTSHTITVTVRWTDQVVAFAKDVEPVRAAIVGLGTLAVTILGWFGIRKAIRRRSPRRRTNKDA